MKDNVWKELVRADARGEPVGRPMHQQLVLRVAGDRETTQTILMCDFIRSRPSEMKVAMVVQGSASSR